VQAIRSAATEALWPGTRVGLFGSRLDDAARGGDIDLLVQPPMAPEASDGVARRHRLVARLYRLLQERRIDVVLDSPTPGPAQPFAEAARRQAVELVQT
jgi:predicted nucleotidyltransferase